MSFQPILPSNGLVGWRFLNKTLDQQSENHAARTDISREIAHLQKALPNVKTVDDLMADQQLLGTVLEAYGLGDDRNHRAFVRKILESDLEDSKSLANRLSDDRYKSLAKDFGFQNASGPNTQKVLFSAELVSKFKRASFEEAVGEQDNSLRLGLYTDRTLDEITVGSGSNNAKWYRILASPPMRKVFETALGLPSSFGNLDLDRQLSDIKTKMKTTFGTDQIDDLQDTDLKTKLTERFLLREQVKNSASYNPMSTALTLLQNQA